MIKKGKKETHPEKGKNKDRRKNYRANEYKRVSKKAIYVYKINYMLLSKSNRGCMMVAR